MTRTFPAVASVCLAVVGLGGRNLVLAQRSQPDVQVVPVQGDVYMIAGAGGNVAFNVGAVGIVVVDTGAQAMSDKVLASIRRISDGPIRYVINTSIDLDHTGGNEAIVKAGHAIPVREILEPTAVLIAQENILNRMSAPSGKTPPRPVAAWPTATYFTPEKDLFFNGQAVQIFHEPAAHTDGDTVVFFRRSDVLVTGEIFDKTRYPVIDRAKGGTLKGVIAGLNHLLDLAVAGEKEEGGTMIIPAHGRLCDEADLSEYRDMVTIVRDRIEDMVKKGHTLEQVKAARPTLDYDGLYGSTSGPWTTDMFIETMYRELNAKK
jgi:glyoxylase-like metal-dependent hydrolase (beta-lactamase superfamily II)